MKHVHFKTLGEFREQTADLPDNTRFLVDIWRDGILVDFEEEVENPTVSIETRCDEIQTVFITVELPTDI